MPVFLETSKEQRKQLNMLYLFKGCQTFGDDATYRTFPYSMELGILGLKQKFFVNAIKWLVNK